MISLQFNGDNLDAVTNFCSADLIKSGVLVGAADADPDLRIAGKRYVRVDLPQWGEEEFYAHVVEGDWLVRWTPELPVVRYYPEDYDSTYGTPAPDIAVLASQVDELSATVDQLILDALMGGM